MSIITQRSAQLERQAQSNDPFMALRRSLILRRLLILRCSLPLVIVMCVSNFVCEQSRAQNLSHPLAPTTLDAALSSLSQHSAEYGRSSIIPWVSPLRWNPRYLATQRMRAHALTQLTHQKSVEVLTPLDRYILAYATGKNTLDELPRSLEGKLSLSHTWRGGSDGYLLNARKLPEHPYWIQRRFKCYGTPEMIAVIKEGARALRARFPKAPRVIIGDLSKRYGGHFPPHLSHQSGRDADIGYFIKGSYSHRLIGLTRVTSRTIDVEKTWTFLGAMIKTGLIESVFMDYKLQRALYRYAKTLPNWTQAELGEIFSYPVWKGKLISHLRGHSDHMHIRFRAPLSERVATQFMQTHSRLRFRPQRRYAKPKARERLTALARRFRVSPRALIKWNRLTERQARAPLKRGRKFVVGYHTPYRLRTLKFGEAPQLVASRKARPSSGPRGAHKSR